MNTPATTPLIRHVEDWRAIVTLNAYRCLIAFGLVALLLFGATTTLFDVTMPDLFRLASLIYLAQSALAMVAALLRWPALRFQILVACSVDVGFFTCLALTSMGVAGGLGMLLLAPMAAAGMLLPGRIASLLAACAAIGIIGQEAWRGLRFDDATEDFVQAGILGTLFFVTVGLSHWLARRARVSEALAAERATEVRDLATLNRRIIQQMNIGAVVIDAEHRIELINDAAVALLDLEQMPVAGEPLALLAPALDDALDQWRAHPHAAIAPVSSGQQSLLPLFSRLGNDAGAPVLIFLEDAVRQREQAQQLKLVSIGRLTSNIAHEIRNPLGAISHAGQLLAESHAMSDDEIRLLDIIHRHTRRIDGIVNNVLGLSRRSRLARRPLPIAQWLADTVEDYRETGEDVPDFSIKAIADDLQVEFDPDHLRQVLFNLWDNAQRYARREDAELAIELSGGHNRTGQFCLDVRDNGPGIDVAIADEIMEPFFTTAREGTGLGLHIASELCEANGARLLPVAQSAGACFRIVFAHVWSGDMPVAASPRIKQVQ
ncbi:sensor histidine kinase [Salinisphaera aquimarina]|uniref:histidine kinase n=1 Tax=Salinisphaera aquimarina TaxID=2094031 RepID=A0ABV7EKJ9_9GAMM